MDQSIISVFKERGEAVRQRYFSRIPMNIFPEMMVEVEEQFAALKKEMIADVAQKRRDLFIPARPGG